MADSASSAPNRCVELISRITVNVLSVWMDTVKCVFGVILLGVAILMLERVLPGPVTLMLWAMLLIIPAVYMGALDSLPDGVSGWRRFWKGLGVAMLVYGVILILGAATGARDPLQPLRNLTAASGITASGEHASRHLARPRWRKATARGNR